MDYTEEQLNQAFERLPEDIQSAIADAATEKRVAAIGERHNLHVDQIGKLADETGLVMLGLDHPDKFVSNLIKRLGVSPAEAETIAGEINAEVFAGLRQSIKRLADQPAGESPVPAPANAFAKVSPIFDLPAKKAWEQDPYLADPSKM